MHGKENDMNKMIKIPVTAASVGAGLFAASLLIYFFNLDMKLMALAEPIVAKWYDCIERRPMEPPHCG